MLVLSRKKDEVVCLPDLGVNIKVLGVKGNSVRLGIDAPEDIHILRGELNDFRQDFGTEYSIPFEGLAEHEQQFA